MFESILKNAIDDPEFEFKTRTTPFPATDALEKSFFTQDELAEVTKGITNVM